jgi:hypothetical protein
MPMNQLVFSAPTRTCPECIHDDLSILMAKGNRVVEDMCRCTSALSIRMLMQRHIRHRFCLFSALFPSGQESFGLSVGKRALPNAA